MTEQPEAYLPTIVDGNTGEIISQRSVADVLAHVNFIKTVMEKAMEKDHHYGRIPGTDKPTLLKPGAELLHMSFRLDPQLEVTRRDLPNGHREYEVITTLYHIDTGKRLGSGVGMCSTMESKYRYRSAGGEDTGVPVPGEYWGLKKSGKLAEAQQAIGGREFRPGKNDDGSWMIFRKTDERVENPDIADTYNTVLKMAKKRSGVDAVLTVTAASDIFTQDVEDSIHHTEEPKSTKTTKKSAAPPAKKDEETPLPDVEKKHQGFLAQVERELRAAKDAKELDMIAQKYAEGIAAMPPESKATKYLDDLSAELRDKFGVEDELPF